MRYIDSLVRRERVICETEICWSMVSAIGQVAGAFATFLAVGISLWLAIYGRRPRLGLTVGERLIIGGLEDGLTVIAFIVVNKGERPVHIAGIGWRTGTLRWGPEFLTRMNAVQVAAALPISVEPPYELQPGASKTSYVKLQNVLDQLGKNVERPFFSRDWPVFGRHRTKIDGYVYSADGYMVHVAVEKSLALKLAMAEINAKA